MRNAPSLRDGPLGAADPVRGKACVLVMPVVGGFLGVFRCCGRVALGGHDLDLRA